LVDIESIMIRPTGSRYFECNQITCDCEIRLIKSSIDGSRRRTNRR